MSLYAIKTELTTLLDAADGGLDSPEAQAALAEHAAALVEAFDDKADDYAALIRSCEARATARREEVKRMAALADADEALADRLRATLLTAMQETNRTKVDTARFKIAVRRNGGKVPVEVPDPTALPDEYLIPKVTMTVDRDALRTALEAGTEVPGASLGERGWRLDLK
jgi:hypothetical protein